MWLPCSRRRFLAGLAGTLAGPALLSSCGRNRSDKPGQNGSLAEDANLDDVPDVASVRPPLPKSEPTIRVRVLKARATSTALRIGADNQWLRLHRVNTPGRGVALAGPVLITLESSGWSVIDSKGFRAPGNNREPVEIGTLEDDPHTSTLTMLELGNDRQPIAGAAPKKYPGVLRFVARPDLDPPPATSTTGAPAGPRLPGGAFDVINDVPLETYLPGVLAGELYRTWQLETFAAQAIAARSFACTEIAVFADRRHYDVSNTTTSQMYVGSVSDEKPRQAVAMTGGLVLGYDGLLVSGYYSSCCGGVAAGASDAIGSNAINDVAPLQGRPEPDVCQSSPHFQWKQEMPIELLTRRMIAFGKERRIKELIDLTRVEAIDVIRSNAHGRPTHMRITDAQQTTFEMTAENFRRAANYSGQGLNPPEKPLKSSFLRALFKRDTVSLEGFGFGHGVGLCQFGAEALAKSGKTHIEIVQWYYPGVELVPAY